MIRQSSNVVATRVVITKLRTPGEAGPDGLPSEFKKKLSAFYYVSIVYNLQYFSTDWLVH